MPYPSMNYLKEGNSVIQRLERGIGETFPLLTSGREPRRISHGQP